MTCYKLQADGSIELKVFLNSKGNEVYIPPGVEEPVGASFARIVRAAEFDPSKVSMEELLICSVPGLPSFDVDCLDRIEGDTIIFIDGQKKTIENSLLVAAEKVSLFVQPAQLNRCESRRISRKYAVFQICESDVDFNNFKFLKTPSFVQSFFAFETLVQGEVKSGRNIRLVLNASDGWLDEKSSRFIGASVQNKFSFQKFVDEISGQEYLISREFEMVKDFLEELNKTDLKSSFEFSCLKINEKKPKKDLIPYGFEAPFVGWNLIVYPFICFVEGLSLIPQLYLYARIAHLSQSSGYGKTRLCFELLKYYDRGIYCVFRRGIDSGFPVTSPWMQTLFNFFDNCKSDSESEQLCLNFIGWAVETFSKGKENENLKSDLCAYFDGRSSLPKELEFTNAHKTIDEIASMVGNELFTIIIDECHEFIYPPKNSDTLISLYRAFRRTLNKLVAAPIVAVFLGTKSSLGDFVLAGKFKPSARIATVRENQIFDVPVYIFTHSCNSMLNSSFNVSFENVAGTKIVDGVEIPCSETMQAIAWRCGRPLWSQYKSFGEALTIANFKLTGDEQLAEITSIVLRTGASVIPQDTLSHELVLSGLATLVHVDIKGSRCIIEYVPEPILSSTARIHLLNMNTFKKSLTEYIRRLRLGAFQESGAAGEQVGRIVLLRLVDMMTLFPERTCLVPFSKDEASFLAAETLLGQQNSPQVAEFADRVDNIRSVAKINSESGSKPSKQTWKPSTDASDSAPGSLCFYSPTLTLVTVRQFLLFASKGRFDDELWKLGVSDQVLDGMISFSQFVNMDAPLVMNQVYLMQAFARGCALTPPAGTPGLDAIIPVLRTDNKMSCIVVQFKNFDVRTFPYDSADVSAKLGKKMLNFLNFESVGDFERADPDDFVRLVIQFGPREDYDKDHLFHWTRIPGSKSCANEPRQPEKYNLRPSTQSTSNSCHALWLHGLNALDHSFFKDSEVFNLLDTILSGSKDVYSHMDYSLFPLPTFVQSTEEGARFLSRLAKPLANYANLVPYEEQMRLNPDEFDWHILKDRMELLQMPSDAFDAFKNCKISPKATTRPSTSEPFEPIPHPVLGQIVTLNKTHAGGSAALDRYHLCETDFIRKLNIYQPRIEAKINAIEVKRRQAAQSISFAVEENAERVISSMISQLGGYSASGENIAEMLPGLVTIVHESRPSVAELVDQFEGSLSIEAEEKSAEKNKYE